MLNSSNSIWISWHYAARSRNLSKKLDIPLYEYFINDNLIQRHLFSSLWTIWILIKYRPKVVVIQLSFMLLNIVAVYKLLTLGRTKIIADCHTKALRRKAKGVLNLIFMPIKKFTFKLVNISIITNKGMIKDVEYMNKNYLILPDKIPENIINKSKKDKPYCVNISSFAVDEPFEEIFDVAKQLNNKVEIYWTGNRPNSKPLPKELSKNLHFTGYISFEEYYDLIGNSDCILGLTTEQDCLQSGAYEALNVEVPMVISDTKALREYFLDSAIYTDHNPDNISRNIMKAIEESENQKENIRKVKLLRNSEFEEKIIELKKYLV